MGATKKRFTCNHRGCTFSAKKTKIGEKKKVKKIGKPVTIGIIPWYPISYLTIASSGFFLGAYGSLPDAAIWWCLRTGGGGVLTRCIPIFTIPACTSTYPTDNCTLVTPNWHQKSANHGSRQLLPLASPMDRRRPNHAYQPLPHIIGDAAYAWFGRPTCRGPDI